MAEVAPEALFQAAVERLLADVPERRVAEVVAEPDRLHEVLVQAQRPRHRPRDRGHLQRVREAGAVVVAPRRHEHLRLVGQAPERLPVHDPVAVALEGRPQRAVLLGVRAPGGIGARRQRREQLLLLGRDPSRERGRDGPGAGRAQLPRFQSLRPVSELVHPVVPAAHARCAILAEDRRPALRRRQLRAAAGVDPQVHAVLVQGIDRRGLHETRLPGLVVDQQAVEDVLLLAR